MIEQPISPGAFAFAIDTAPDARFRLSAVGPGVALMAQNADPATTDPDEITPDPVAYVADCVAAGFFQGHDPQRPAALTVGESRYDAARSRHDWVLEAQNIPAGLYRVLANLLLARGLTGLAFRPVDTPAPEARAFDLRHLSYPQVPRDLRFKLDYARPDKAGSDRFLEVDFRAPPDDPALEASYAMLERWGILAALGAYPRRDQSPRVSGLFPELAHLIGSATLLQDLSAGFACDEAVFAPIVTYYQSGPGRAAPVETIRIR